MRRRPLTYALRLALSAGEPMTKDSYAAIQEELELSDAEMAELLAIDVEDASRYRSGAAQVPAHTGWALRLLAGMAMVLTARRGAPSRLYGQIRRHLRGEYVLRDKPVDDPAGRHARRAERLRRREMAYQMILDGMSQSAVAAELGVTVQAVSKWMRCRIG